MATGIRNDKQIVQYPAWLQTETRESGVELGKTDGFIPGACDKNNGLFIADSLAEKLPYRGNFMLSLIERKIAGK